MVNELRKNLDTLTTETVYKMLEEQKLNAFLKEWKKEVTRLLDEVEEVVDIDWMTDGSVPKKSGRYKTTILNRKNGDKSIEDLYWNGTWWSLVCGSLPFSDKYEVIAWKRIEKPCVNTLV